MQDHSISPKGDDAQRLGVAECMKIVGQSRLKILQAHPMMGGVALAEPCNGTIVATEGTARGLFEAPVSYESNEDEAESL